MDFFEELEGTFGTSRAETARKLAKRVVKEQQQAHPEADIKDWPTLGKQIENAWNPSKWPRNCAIALSPGTPQRPASKLQLLPWLAELARHLWENNKSHPGLRIINRRFLADAYDLKLYRPYSADHRLHYLFDAFYFPDHPDLDFDLHIRLASILAFNGDHALYQHLYVIYDRTLSSASHKSRTLKKLPTIALITGLAGDYEQAVQICDQGIKQIKEQTHTGRQQEPLYLEFLEQELACLMADSGCLIPEPTDIRTACEKPAAQLARATNFCALHQNLPWSAHLKRLHLCAYFRCLTRTILHFRGLANANGQIHYELPDGIIDKITEYQSLINQYANHLATQNIDSSHTDDYQPVNTGWHYLGLDADTISRAYCLLSTEIALMSNRDKRSSSCKKLIADALELAKRNHEDSVKYFGYGDAEDSDFVIAHINKLAPNLKFHKIECDVLSAYRIYTGQCILSYAQAVHSTKGESFLHHKTNALNSLKTLRGKLRPERMRHSRTLSRALTVLLEGLTLKNKLDFLH